MDQKTFRVRSRHITPNQSKVPSRFVFSSTKNDIPEYKNAREMWNKKIQWDAIRAKIDAGTRGSQVEAEQIRQLLLRLEWIMTKNPEFLTEDEQQVLIELTRVKVGGPGQIAQSLLLYNPPSGKAKNGKSYVNYAAAGFSFEKHIDELLQSLFVENKSYRTGAVRVGSRLNAFRGSDFTDINKLVVDKDGKLSAASRKILQQEVKNTLGEGLSDLLGSFKYELDFDGNTLRDVLIRQVDVDQKIDIEVPSSVTIKSDLPHELAELANLMVDRTFSLKNYNSFNAQRNGIFVGNANEFRRASSFYFFSTGSSNNADICTFIFASEASKDKVVKKYISWERFLYELLGVGQLDNGRLVDYILINFYDKPGAENLIINSTREYLKNMPEGEPSFMLIGGHMKAVQF